MKKSIPIPVVVILIILVLAGIFAYFFRITELEPTKQLTKEEKARVMSQMKAKPGATDNPSAPPPPAKN